MELRHLRYFVAVADAGSLTVAAEQKLHTSQPSLSRQIRDLEQEVGVQLINRSAHGVELTSAGKAFLDHARMSLLQAEAAKEAALRAAQPPRPTFALGFMSGAEIGLLPEVERILRDEFPGSRMPSTFILLNVLIVQVKNLPMPVSIICALTIAQMRARV